MPDDDRIGAASPAEWIAVFAVLAVIAGEAAYLLSVHLWID